MGGFSDIADVIEACKHMERILAPTDCHKLRFAIPGEHHSRQEGVHAPWFSLHRCNVSQTFQIPPNPPDQRTSFGPTFGKQNLDLLH